MREKDNAEHVCPAGRDEMDGCEVIQLDKGGPWYVTDEWEDSQITVKFCPFCGMELPK